MSDDQLGAECADNMPAHWDTVVAKVAPSRPPAGFEDRKERRSHPCLKGAGLDTGRSYRDWFGSMPPQRLRLHAKVYSTDV